MTLFRSMVADEESRYDVEETKWLFMRAGMGCVIIRRPETGDQNKHSIVVEVRH